MDFSTQTQMKNRLVNKGPFQDLSKSVCVTNYICPSFNDSTEEQRVVPAKQQQQKKK